MLDGADLVGTVDGCDLLIWASAETSTTIMATCVPAMRVLFREVGSTMRSFAVQTKKSTAFGDEYGKSSTAPSTGQDSTKRSRVTSYPPSISPLQPIMTPLPHAHSTVKGDGDSDKSFLPIQGHGNSPPPSYAGSGIIRTREVEIEFQDRDDCESKHDYEMTAVAL